LENSRRAGYQRHFLSDRRQKRFTGPARAAVAQHAETVPPSGIQLPDTNRADRESSTRIDVDGSDDRERRLSVCRNP
jgi:hypothetical protein